MGVLELKVPMKSDRCERLVRRALFMPGIDTVDIDRQLQKVTITGAADPKRIFKRLRRAGKPVELWPAHLYDLKTAAVYAPLSTLYEEQYYDHDYGFEQRYRPPVEDDRLTTMFSPENPNAACSIM